MGRDSLPLHKNLTSALPADLNRSFLLTYLMCIEDVLGQHTVYILSVNKFVMVSRHESFKRMTDEHKFEIAGKNSLLGNGRQAAE